MPNFKSRNLVAKSLEMSAVEIVRSRRACTVPQQLLRSYELPSLPTAHNIPKRYEETKPVRVQDFTHQRIIDLGEFINRQAKEESEYQRKSAVEKAIADTWEAAHEVKMDAVKEAVHKSQIQHEKQLRRQAKKHERTVKEEMLVVETLMQNKMRESLEAERIIASKRLEEMIKVVKEQCAIELQKSVAVAREEEQKVAALQQENDKGEFVLTMRATQEALEHERKEALHELTERKEKEQTEAVKKAHFEEQIIRASALSELRESHSLDISNLKQVINDVESQITEKDCEIEKVHLKREQLYDELIKVQADYQHFIDKHPLFDPGQTSFLLPDVIANPKIINPYNDRKVNQRTVNFK